MVNALLGSESEWCVNGHCELAKTALDHTFKNVQKFDYKYEVIAGSSAGGIVTFHSYIESMSGCSMMYKNTIYFTIDEFKISKAYSVMDDTEYEEFTKCLLL